MQITVIFKGDKIKLPIATGETVQGLIYRAISEDWNYSTLIHDSGKVFDGRSFKLFTFSELKGKYTIEGKTITYLTDVKLEIRSADAYFIQLLLMYFTSQQYVQLGANRVKVCDVKLNNTVVFEKEVVIRTSSPITVYITESDRHTVYFTPEDKEFYSLICSNARRKWISHYGDENGFELSITPLENTRFIKRATRFKDTFITAWHGGFVLTGSPKVIDFLYNTGIGSKNSQGFGMFDIVEKIE